MDKHFRTKHLSFLTLICLLLATALSGTTEAAWVARHDMNSQQYQAEFDKWVAKGYRLNKVGGYTRNGNVLYTAIWDNTSGPAWQARHGMTSSDYRNTHIAMIQKGYFPVHVSAFETNNGSRFAAIWEQAKTLAVAMHDLSADTLQSYTKKLRYFGFEISVVSGYSIKGTDYYAAIWQRTGQKFNPFLKVLPPSQRLLQYDMSAAEYQSNFEINASRGFQLLHVDGYDLNGSTRFAAVWDTNTRNEWLAQHNIIDRDYQTAFNDKLYEGYELKNVSAYAQDGHASFATIWHSNALANGDRAFINAQVESFMTTHNVPAVSIAIARDEKLVYAKAFGFASRETGERANSDHRFRIASITKPITSTAIFSLVDQGSLSLDDKVFGPQGILGERYGSQPYSPELLQLTVEQLLQHTAGGWSGFDDPTFAYQWLPKDEQISLTLDNYPLATPGGQYGYSNFGYALLGRIIEQTSGRSYGDYVQQQLLAPAGSPLMALARTAQAERYPNEVTYYDDNYDPYGYNIANMDSQGGWVATPVELLRFLVRVDGRPGKADLLSAQSLDIMLNQPSAVAPFYSHGWFLEPGDSRAHDGSVPGTRTVMSNLGNGFSMAIFTNTRSANDGQYFNALYQLPLTLIDSVTDWPQGDFFNAP